jgi:hypothetical protein
MNQVLFLASSVGRAHASEVEPCRRDLGFGHAHWNQVLFLASSVGRAQEVNPRMKMAISPSCEATLHLQLLGFTWPNPVRVATRRS